MSWWCFGDVSVISRLCVVCFMDDSVISRRCFSDSLVMCQDVSACANSVLVIFKWCVGDVSGVSRWCVVIALWCFGDMWVMPWFCVGDVSALCRWCCGVSVMGGDAAVIVMILWCFGDEYWWTLWDLQWVPKKKRVAVRCVFAIGVVCRANFSNIFRPKNFVLARPKYFVGFKLETIFFGPFCQSTRMLLHTHLCIRVSFVFVNAQCTSGIMINGLTIGRNQEKWRSFSAKKPGLANRGQLNAPPKRVLSIENDAGVSEFNCAQQRFESSIMFPISKMPKQSPCDKSNLQHQANGELKAGCRESKEDSLINEMFERIAEMNSVGVPKQNAVYTWKKPRHRCSRSVSASSGI